TRAVLMLHPCDNYYPSVIYDQQPQQRSASGLRVAKKKCRENWDEMSFNDAFELAAYE
ncbi:unnamed protein product, partial [Symbiodinium microadriaticum]